MAYSSCDDSSYLPAGNVTAIYGLFDSLQAGLLTHPKQHQIETDYAPDEQPHSSAAAFLGTPPP